MNAKLAIDSFHECAGTLVTESGVWVPVIDSGQVSTSANPLTAEFLPALGGRTAFFRGVAPATWSVSGTGSWAQAQAVYRLGKMTGQKFYWVSPLGRHTNILPSEKPRYGAPLGIQAPDGVPVEVYGPNQYGHNTSTLAPAYEGMRVVISAYQAGGRLRIWWKKADGSTVIGPEAAAPSTLGLVEVEGVAPAGIVGIEMIGLDCSLFAAPAVRIGTDAQKFSPGPAGCGWVTLHDVEISHKNIAYAHSPISISFTLKEVT